MRGCRPVLYSDIDWIVEELRDLPKQSAYFQDVPDDPAYVKLWLTSAVAQGLFGVCAPDKSSFLLACVQRPWYANRTEINEMILWVPERHRGARTAIELIRGFTELALEYEPHSIHVGATLDITTADRTLKLYEMCGYTRHGPQGAIMRP